MKANKPQFKIDKSLQETLKAYATAEIDRETQEEILRYSNYEEITFWKPKAAFLTLG